MKKAISVGLFGFLFEINQLLNPNVATSQTQDSVQVKKEVKGKTILLPPKEFYNAWPTGTTLTQYVLEIDGPLNLDLKGMFDNKPIDAYIEYANLETVVNQFKRTNPKLKKNLFKNELAKYPLLSKEIASIFSDGKVLTKEELDKLDKLNDGKYVFPFFYVAKDKKASLPGIFIVDKHGENFNYEHLFAVQELEKPKVIIHEEKPTAEKPKEEEKEVPNAYVPTLELNAGISVIDGRKEKNELNFGLGINLKRYFLGLTDFLGINFGYAKATESEPDKVVNTVRNPITGFYGQGITKLEKRIYYSDLAFEFGRFFSKSENNKLYIRPYSGAGLALNHVVNNSRVEENLLNSKNEVISSNSDNYSNVRDAYHGKFYAGLDLVTDNFVLGAKAGLRGSEKFGGVNLGVRIPFRNKSHLKK